MATLKLKKRQLFRTQALKFFVGVFGDNSAPTLLFAWPKYMGTVSIAACLLLTFTWLGLAQHPIRLNASGQLQQVSANLYCFTTPHKNPKFDNINAAQAGVLFFEKEHVRVEIAASPCSKQAIPLYLDHHIQAVGKEVQLSLTVGHEPIWSFLLGEFYEH